MGAGDEGVGLVEVCAEFVGVAGFAGVVSGGGDAAAEGGGGFEAGDVVALPAVEGDGDGGECGEGFVGVYAEGGVLFFGEGVGGGHDDWPF